MKKLIIYIFLIINIFPATKSIGVFSGVNDNIYENKEKYFVFPFFSYRNKFISVNGLNVGTSIPYKGVFYSLTLEPGFFQKVLEKGDLNGIIEEDRDSPIFLSLSASKNFKNFNLNSTYKREFSSDGNLLGLGASYIYFFDKNYKYSLIPAINYWYFDGSYSDYYFNLTEEEYANLSRQYKSLDNSYSLDYSINSRIVLDEKSSLILSYKLNYISQNKIRQDSKKYFDTFSLGYSYKF